MTNNVINLTEAVNKRVKNEVDFDVATAVKMCAYEVLKLSEQPNKAGMIAVMFDNDGGVELILGGELSPVDAADVLEDVIYEILDM